MTVSYLCILEYRFTLVSLFLDCLVAAGMTSFLQVSLVISPYLKLVMKYLNPAMLKLALEFFVPGSLHI